ncbi:hypothetical protein [Clostridium sp. HMP27]|uniref:hypothetical protein n=1 Tax=Clostridium sp. HMP27 TaxID=1487921 RepID=UPI00052D5678|nr:hypothetical protein [Clostridium sp. HMP27]KGK82896.1 hypothetical protein DP68_17365 [Clostridium sp. HMP27]
MNNEKFIRRWEKTRQKSEEIYIFTNGLVMGTGMCMGAIINKLIIHKNSFDFYMYFENFIAGFIGGIIPAIISWSKNEKRYNELINNNLKKQ